MVDVFPQSETDINVAVSLFKNDDWNPQYIDFEGYLELKVTRYVFKKKEGIPEDKFEFALNTEEIKFH